MYKGSSLITRIKKRGYTAEENRPEEEEENHIVFMDPLYKYFLENYRPVAKSFGHDIHNDNVFGSAKTLEDKCTENEDDDNVIPDHQYKLFLENLRPDGKSYALDMTEANVYVKYEPSSPEPEALNVFTIENENRVSNVAIVDTEMHAHAKYDGKCRGRKPKDPNLHAGKSGNGGGSHVASEAQNHAGNHIGKHSGGEQRGKEIFADKNPTSKHIRWEPHVLGRPSKNPTGSASDNHVASETRNHVPNYSDKRRGRKPRGFSKLQATQNPIGNSNHVACEAHRHEHAGNQMDKCSGREQKGKKLSADKNPTVSTNSNQIDSEAQNYDLNYKGKRRGRKPKAGPELHATKNPNDNSNHLVSAAHKHEHAGLRRSNKAKTNAVPSVEGQIVVNEIKEEIDDDVPHIRRLVHSPVLNDKIFCDDDDEANPRKRTKYREKLMEELKKPYCQEEYERLFKDITVRKPAQGERVLRGRTKTYEEDYVSKSYLDCHIDLQRKIYTARDDYPKVLNLMRGFFYWLVNVSHEGKFRPWRVQSYLDELLQQ